MMIKNNFKIALRNLKSRKAYTLINVIGLTLGISCAIVIFTLVKYHLSFDTFHSKADRIYRVITESQTEGTSYNSGTPSPLGEAIREDYTFTEKVARVASFSKSLISFNSSGGIMKFEENIAFAEQSFFDILDFPLIRGNNQSILGEPNTAIITERIAAKYFSGEDPIGQTIRIGNKLDVIITGILSNLPANTDRQQEIYLPFDNLADYSPGLVEKDWWFSLNRNMQCFVVLKPGITPTDANKALYSISEKHYNKSMVNLFQFKLQHLSDIHFNPDLGGYIEKKNLWILSIMAFFLIVTACVNFINLATAQALTRSRGIGVRKVAGSSRIQIFWQYISETSIISLIAFVLSIGIAYFTLPFMNNIFHTSLKINIFHDIFLVEFLLLLFLLVVFLSGSYPGIVLSGVKPVLALKGKLSQKQAGSFSSRKGLVIGQFAISQFLIICTIVIANQMRYDQQADMGFKKDAIIMLPVPDNSKSKLSSLGLQLSEIAGIEQLSFCNAAPASQIVPSTGIKIDSHSESEKFSIYLKAGDHNYVSTFELNILEGRNLNPSDTIREYLLNETAVHKLGIIPTKDVIGQSATINGKRGTIVGIVKDFHNKSFHESIDPVYITTLSDNYASCAVKINMNNLKPTMEALEEVWEKVYPENMYKYDFLDEQIAKFYEFDNTMYRLIQIFGAMVIIIGCLGLYGLISFIAAQKTKEIGVRKVNGARISEVLVMLNRDFVKWVAIAFVIATPIAWYAMHKWLENFAYKTTLSWWIFALAGLLALGIALLTVSWQSWKAATRNPVDALRYE